MCLLLFERLSIRLALWMVLATVIMQGAHAFYRISVDIPKAKAHEIEKVDKLIHSLLPAFSESLFQYNDGLTQQLLKTFSEYPSVYHVDLLDEDSNVVSQWQRPEDGVENIEHFISTDLVYESQVIGSLKVTLDLTPILFLSESEIKERIWFSSMMGVISLMLLYFVAQGQVTLPITRLTNEVTMLNTLTLKPGEIERLDEIKANAEVRILRNSLKKILLELSENLAENKRSHDLLKEFSEELESKVKERTDELAISTEKAERANQAKTDFMNTMTHELRTPLNSIMGFSSILKGQELPDKLAGLVDKVHGSGGQLLQLINDIIDYVDLESKPLMEQRFSLFDVVNSVFMECKLEAVNNSLKLSQDVDQSLILKGDPKRLSMALRHVVGNAIKFTEKGCVEIEAFKDEQDCICLTVTDTGPGIDLSRITDLSESFVQMDQSLARTKEGVGLGLAIVDRVCRKWGAELDFSHIEPHGTKVTIKLPDLELQSKC